MLKVIILKEKTPSFMRRYISCHILKNPIRNIFNFLKISIFWLGKNKFVIQ